jgi:hypothetical protein
MQQTAPQLQMVQRAWKLVSPQVEVPLLVLRLLAYICFAMHSAAHRLSRTAR